MEAGESVFTYATMFALESLSSVGSVYNNQPRFQERLRFSRFQTA